MKKILIPLCTLMLTLADTASSGESAFNAVLRVSDGKIITFSQMMDDVKKAGIVFVGEVHDDSEHHRLELAIIRAFHESDTPMAIGLEMFRADSQDVLDSWVRGKLTVEQFMPAYYDNWRLPWHLYHDIYWYARDHEIRLVGLNIPYRLAEKVGRQGFASLTEQEKKRLPPGISCTVDRTYREFIKKAYAGHSAGDRPFENFCEAQMVWDKSMAWHLAQYLKQNPNTTVVVLAGVGHAWKRGIPEQATTESRFTYRVILPLVTGQIDKKTVTLQDADYVVLR